MQKYDGLSGIGGGNMSGMQNSPRSSNNNLDIMEYGLLKGDKKKVSTFYNYSNNVPQTAL
jgi:hypothetical protein